MSNYGKKLGPKGSKQAEIVMRTFYAHNLHGKDNKLITDVEQAKAIATSEGRAAETRGTEVRSFEGRKRIRPKLKG